MKKLKFLTQGRLAVAIVVMVLAIDQLIKIAVKTNMFLYERIHIADWFYIYFTENNGMAFGMEIFAKLFLTLFRIVAVILISGYLYRIVHQSHRYQTGYIVCLSFILAGAIGNIIDCVFYGCIFTDPYPPMVATMVPWGEGYGTLFHGLVVDMIHLPLFDFYWPDWMPWIGGDHFTFFDPVFNLADAAISVGIIVLIFRYAQCLPYQKEEQDDDQPQEADDNA